MQWDQARNKISSRLFPYDIIIPSPDSLVQQIKLILHNIHKLCQQKEQIETKENK